MHKILFPLLLALLLPLPASAAAPAMSVFFYDDGHDAFIRELAAELGEQAHKQGLTLRFEHAAFDPMVQISQIREGLRDRLRLPQAIIVNPAEIEVIAEAVRLAREAQVPVIFFNRVGDLTPLLSYERAWCVKDLLREQGHLQADLFKAIEEIVPDIDRNRNGSLDVVMLLGENHSEATTARTNGFMERVGGGRHPVNIISRLHANWSEEEAFHLMQAQIQNFAPGTIDAIVCNNDAMALGAIRALNAIGFNTGVKGEPLIPVIGIDGTAGAVDAILDHKMVGTIEQPRATIARALLDLGQKLADLKPLKFDPELKLKVDAQRHIVFFSDRLLLRETVLQTGKTPDGGRD